jgi:Xaa-Pro aminopeptidase
MVVTSINTYSSRLKAIRQALRSKGLDGLLVTDINNIRYLTDFSGSSGLLIITATGQFFVTDFRYKEQSGKEVAGWDIIIETGNGLKIIQDLSKKNSIGKLGVESSVSYEFFKKISGIGIGLAPLQGTIEKLREIKDKVEIDSINKAIRRAEAAFTDVKPYIKEGAKEMAIARRLEEQLKKQGCSNIPFEIIIASGPNSAMPHAKPTEKKLNKGDFVIIDWGGEADGYFSDMTRTFLLKGGVETGKKKEVYNTVLEANQKAISHIVPGIQSKKIDEAARDFIRKAGFGEFFGHGTGHGVGLQVHEAPRISWTRSQPVRKNMVFTIEPGIYIPGLGGVRIEDIIAVGENKASVLTSLPKKLKIV